MNSLLIQYTKSLSIKHLKSTIIPFKSRIQMYSSEEVIDPSDTVLTIPNTERQVKETLEMKKQRLLYQSKRRGMLENDLLFGSFASKYLDSFSKEETDIYDMLINKPSNEWDLYYWATGVKPIPQEFQNKIMDLLVDHCNNLYKEYVANKS